jgi:prolactin regulatory element-binding protein
MSREDNQAGESEEVIKELRDVGQQLALAFNPEGSVLAAGAEDGTLRVFKWPSMNTLLNESQAHSSVKCLTFRFAFSYQIREILAIRKVVHSLG